MDKFASDDATTSTEHVRLLRAEQACRIRSSLLKSEPLNMSGVFIIGTDTEVGKTYQAVKLAQALCARSIRVGVYKPVASGVVDQVISDLSASTSSPPHDHMHSDATLLQAAAQTPVPIERICPQSFRAPLAPPMAAGLEGRAVDEPLLRTGAEWWTNACDFLIVEGAGGALSPISASLTVLDLASNLGLPLIVVAANRLGVVNHVLLTIEAAASRGLDIIGIILNNLPPSPTDPPALSAQVVGTSSRNVTASCLTEAASAQTTNRQLLQSFVEQHMPVVDSIESLLPYLFHGAVPP